MASKATNLRGLEAYQAANLEAARIIAGNPELYPPGSLLATWAEMVLRDGINVGAELTGRAGLGPPGQAERQGAAATRGGGLEHPPGLGPLRLSSAASRKFRKSSAQGPAHWDVAGLCMALRIGVRSCGCCRTSNARR